MTPDPMDIRTACWSARPAGRRAPAGARRVASRVALALALAVATPAAAQPPADAPADSASSTLVFEPAPPDSVDGAPRIEVSGGSDADWLQTPFGDHLLTDPGRWRDEGRRPRAGTGFLDYNRVDRLRLGVGFEWQSLEALHPRIGTRLEYAFGRDRVLYGIQIEQPLARPGRLSAGVSMVRRTDHPDLQQTGDFENSLALLFGRQDDRDYFEREGAGAYLSWRVPDFSTVSVHGRVDEYRSLPLDRGTRSWFHRDRALRDNPAVDDGEIRAALVRLERLARRTRASRAGLYHWIEVERAEFDSAGEGGVVRRYTRALADLRGVLRLTPATTLSLRAVAGSALDGALPRQKEFVVGGVDGLRAHAFGSVRGDQLALVQAEYEVSLWELNADPLDAGLSLFAFVDAGAAWRGRRTAFDIGRQVFACDGGVGLGTGDDGLRLYFARDLQDPGSEVVVSLRLQRPF